MDDENVYPYGGAEHFAYSAQLQFDPGIAAFILWTCNRELDGRSISSFLDGVLERYGFEEAIYCARYLEHFDKMPELMPETRERIALMMLDFDSDSEAS